MQVIVHSRGDETFTISKYTIGMRTRKPHLPFQFDETVFNLELLSQLQCTHGIHVES